MVDTNKAQILECVPNFSEGRDLAVIKAITDEIESVEGVRLLDVDPGAATNRTVVTFVGTPAPVIEAAFLAIRRAAQLIDMSKHSGEHPRMGATDVCPLVPVSNISLEEAAEWAHKLGKRVGDETDVPVFMYEAAATKPERTNLAVIRSGEYEALEKKFQKPEWVPDYGQPTFNPGAGATVIGARDFLIAYNVNLNTTSVRRANAIAFDVREQGRVKREGNPLTGKIIRDENGEAVRIPGKCKAVKAIGWYIEEYGITQISMNLTDTRATSLHEAFEACRESATRRGLRVTGSELVGLIPLNVILDAGKFYLRKQQRSLGIPEAEIIHIAVKSMGLDEISPFDPEKKIIEYQLRSSEKKLVDRTLTGFAEMTASESPAPGGGSVAAYVGALGAALGTMVANLSAHKRGWDDRWEEFSDWAAQGQDIGNKLLALVDEDTAAFNAIIEAVRLPKGSEAEKAARHAAMQAATKLAIQVPFRVMQTASEVFPLCLAMLEQGNPASASDAGVGALCARAAVRGAHFNVLINVPGLEDKNFVNEILNKAKVIEEQAEKREREVVEKLEAML